MRKLSASEIATILAALRQRQHAPAWLPEFFEDCEELGDSEVDLLCEAINLGRVEIEPTPAKYRNSYECPCGETWEDVWSCACNDKCARCGKEIEPSASEECGQ